MVSPRSAPASILVISVPKSFLSLVNCFLSVISTLIPILLNISTVFCSASDKSLSVLLLNLPIRSLILLLSVRSSFIDLPPFVADPNTSSNSALVNPPLPLPKAYFLSILTTSSDLPARIFFIASSTAFLGNKPPAALFKVSLNSFSLLFLLADKPF